VPLHLMAGRCAVDFRISPTVPPPVPGVPNERELGVRFAELRYTSPGS
jgi:hypothetical protein